MDLRRDLPGLRADDVVEPHQHLALAAVVVGVGAGVDVAFEAGVRGDGPDFEVDGPGVAVHALLERDRLPGGIARRCRHAAKAAANARAATRIVISSPPGSSRITSGRFSVSPDSIVKWPIETLLGAGAHGQRVSAPGMSAGVRPPVRVRSSAAPGSSPNRTTRPAARPRWCVGGEAVAIDEERQVHFLPGLRKPVRAEERSGSSRMRRASPPLLGSRRHVRDRADACDRVEEVRARVTCPARHPGITNRSSRTGSARLAYGRTGDTRPNTGRTPSLASPVGCSTGRTDRRRVPARPPRRNVAVRRDAERPDRVREEGGVPLPGTRA